jgi:prolipoprotein diacylglyceryltransferase
MHVVFPTFFLFFYCLFGLLAILGTIFWIWMIVDCATKEPAEGNDKIVWILIILLTHVVGAAIYFFVRRPERRRTVGR